MFGSSLPSLWSLSNQSLLGSGSRHCYVITSSIWKFLPVYLRTRRLGVRISQGAPLLLESDSCSEIAALPRDKTCGFSGRYCENDGRHERRTWADRFSPRSDAVCDARCSIVRAARHSLKQQRAGLLVANEDLEHRRNLGM